MGLILKVHRGKPFKIGKAEITINSISQGSCRVEIKAPEDIRISRSNEREIIFKALMLLREDTEESIEKALDVLADFVRNNYIDEDVNA